MVQRDDASLACWQCGFDSRRVHSIRRVAGYGLPGRFAKPCGRKAVRVQIPCLPLLCPGGEQAVLAKSFRDELVEQDPADEPELGLLECIRVE